jgi:plasmid maintenance system antidote protein VapI
MKSARQQPKTLNAPNFRALLQSELIQRCKANPNYSLRSFARALHIEASSLSQLLNGKRPVTQKMKLRLGSALGMSVQQLKSIPVEELDKSEQASLPDYQHLTLDAFAVISDWYHYAILELTYVKGFKSDAAWIARRLGITKSEANIAIERMLRLELLTVNSKGQWVDASQDGMLTHLTKSSTSDAARRYQCQLLELSQRSVQEIPLSRRNHTSATFCFDPNDLPKAIERITEFRRQFAAEFQPGERAREVYQIQISLFPLTHSVESKGK